ncbi:MAG: 30S ribosomal protein S15 [Candidatus Aenigmarchaeota archaeon]|nr:30S ribosomal protein S15 [Candidatus Aenigmarchaeota archaeon]
MARKKAAQWVEYEKDEIEKIVEKLAKEGHEPAKIGLILRDRYGIPGTRKYGIRILPLVEKNAKKEVPHDMFNLMRQAVELRDHLAQNKNDAKARHALDKIESMIRRLGKYYARSGRLRSGWRYDTGEARLLVKGVGR